MNREKYEEDIRIIRNAMLNNKLLVFVGAGISLDSGVPGWTDAIKIISKRLYGNDIKDIKEGNDTLKIPQYYYNSRGQKEYVELMREIFKFNEDLKITSVHRLIVKLDTHTIITTNYDDLLEKAFYTNNEFVQVIREDKDLSYKVSEKEIIKMHGDFKNNNFVLKEDDYLNYSENFKLIEAYVKSLIATNVVLFLGYSFNDPDVKHIFTWIKNILKNDFQRAYLLNVTESFDQYKFDYFKNLGLNVIYAADLSDRERKARPTERVKIFLEKILKEDEIENDIELLYKRCRAFDGLNYVPEKYLNRLFREYDILCDMGIMRQYEYGKNKDILRSIYDDTDYIREKQVIRSVISKSCIKGVQISDKQSIVVENRAFDYELEEAIRNFDFKKIREISELNEIKLSNENPNGYLKQAYIFYALFDYVKAYRYLRLSSQMFYKNKEYFMYFISEFDRHNLSNIIKTSFFLDIDKEEREKIENESKEIDLEKIYRRIPISTQYSKDFLLDILNYNIYYSKFQKVYFSSKKVEKEARTKYIIFAGETEYNRLRFQIQDIYKFDLYNSLLIDRYIEDVEIYRLFARTILKSVCSRDIKDEYDNTDIGNIHTDELNDFDIFICFKFMPNKELYETLDSLGKNNIPISEAALEYFKRVLKNISDNLDINQVMEYYYNSLTLASYIKLNKEVAEEALGAIIQGFEKDVFNQEYRIIKKFLVNLKKQNYFVDKDLMKKFNVIIDLIIDKIVKSNCKDIKTNNFLIYSLNIYSQVKGRYYSAELLQMTKRANYDLLGSIYGFVSKRIQQQIKKIILNWKWSDTFKDIETYEKFVINNIIEPTRNVEDYIIENIDSTKNTSGVKFYPDQYQQIIGSLLNLLLNNKVIRKKEIRMIIKRSDYPVYLWLADPKRYNYKDFNINWLKLCSKELLKTLSEDKEVKSNILKIVRDTAKVETIDNDSMKLILEYFV